MLFSPAVHTRRARSKGRSRHQQAKPRSGRATPLARRRGDGARTPSLPVVVVFCSTAHVFTWAAADWYRRGLVSLLGLLPRAWSGFLLDQVQRFSRQSAISEVAVATDVTAFYLGLVLVPGLGLAIAVAFRRLQDSRA